MEPIRIVHHGFKEPTPEATRLRQALTDHGIKVLIEVDDGYKFIDLGVPDAKLNIEVDGMQHLTDPTQIVADLNRAYHSQEKNGYSTLHVPNGMIRSHLNEIANALADAIKIREQKIKVHLTKEDNSLFSES